MEEDKDKRVLRVELSDEVKKVSITGKNGDEQVVMRQELSEDDLEQAAGGGGVFVDILQYEDRIFRCPYKGS